MTVCIAVERGSGNNVSAVEGLGGSNVGALLGLSENNVGDLEVLGESNVVVVVVMVAHLIGNMLADVVVKASDAN